jgi:hypothetical protein
MSGALAKLTPDPAHPASRIRVIMVQSARTPPSEELMALVGQINTK